MRNLAETARGSPQHSLVDAGTWQTELPVMGDVEAVWQRYRHDRGRSKLWALGVGDSNHDGQLDIATTTYSGVSVFLYPKP